MRQLGSSLLGYTHSAVLEGEERPAAAWEEVEALCRPVADLEAAQGLLLADIPQLQDACAATQALSNPNRCTCWAPKCASVAGWCWL